MEHTRFAQYDLQFRLYSFAKFGVHKGSMKLQGFKPIGPNRALGSSDGCVRIREPTGARGISLANLTSTNSWLLMLGHTGNRWPFRKLLCNPCTNDVAAPKTACFQRPGSLRPAHWFALEMCGNFGPTLHMLTCTRNFELLHLAPCVSA